MPIRSEAQRRRLQQLAKEGKLDPDTLNKMEDDIADDPLPERVAWPRIPKSQRVKVLRPIRTPRKGL